MRNLKKLLALAVVLALSVSFVLPAMAFKTIDDFADAAAAKDVLADKGGGALTVPYSNAVQFMIDLNVIEGADPLGDGNLVLALDKSLTRAEFAVMLYKALNGGSSIEESGQHFMAMTPGLFNDTAGTWYNGYANAFGTLGISAGVSGDPDNPLFGGNQTITFNEALLLCMKAIGLNTDLEPNFSFDTMSILGIATQLGMVGDLYWMDGGLIDRATAALLLDYTIKARSVIYNITGAGMGGYARARGAGAGDPNDSRWITTKFGLVTETLTVLSDGKWLALGNSLVENGRAILGNVTNNNPTGGDISTGGRVFFSADATEKLGITMKDVGRKINVVYKAASIVEQVYGNFSYADKEDSFMSIGRTGPWVENNPHVNGSLFYDLVTVIGSDSVDLDSVRVYVNYKTDTLAVLNGYGAGGLFGSMTSHVDVGDASYKIDESQLRVIWDTDSEGVNYVRFIFVEYYEYAKFDKVDGGNMKLKEVFSGEGKAMGENKKTSDILGFADLDLKENDRFLTYEIGATKFGVKALGADAVEGRVSQINNTQYDGQQLTIGGRPLILSETLLGSSGLVSGNRIFATQEVPVYVGDTVTLYIFNGKIVEIVQPAPAAARTNYAVVERSERRQTAATTLIGEAAYTYYVRLRFEDNSTGIFELTNASDTSTGTGTAADVIVGGDVILGDVFHYELNSNETAVALYRPGDVEIDLTLPAGGGGYTAQSGRLTDSRWAGTLQDKFMVANSVVFVQTGGTAAAGYTFRAVKGSVPAISASAGAVTGSYRFMDIPGIDDGGVAFIRLMGADMVPPPAASWAVSLDDWKILLIGEDRHYQQLVMTDDGNVVWLTGAKNTSLADNAFVNGAGTANFTIFEYTLNSDGYVASPTTLKTIDALDHAVGVNPASKFLVTNPITLYDADAKFFFIDGADSKLLTADEVAELKVDSWKDENDGKGLCVKHLDIGTDDGLIFINGGDCDCPDVFFSYTAGQDAIIVTTTGDFVFSTANASAIKNDAFRIFNASGAQIGNGYWGMATIRADRKSAYIMLGGSYDTTLPTGTYGVKFNNTAVFAGGDPGSVSITGATTTKQYANTTVNIPMTAIGNNTVTITLAASDQSWVAPVGDWDSLVTFSAGGTGFDDITVVRTSASVITFTFDEAAAAAASDATITIPLEAFTDGWGGWGYRITPADLSVAVSTVAP
ncbi:MAG: hypothetical protein FWG72_04235 [Oscillospiraceae bacterium]|nr:hypothetical protein [Oscillospiraceae bacterium]